MKGKSSVSIKSKLKRFLFAWRQEVILVSLSLGTLLIFIPVFTYSYFARDLTSNVSIMNRNSTGVILLDRNGKEFFKFYEAKYKKIVPLSSVPNHVRQAVIVAEDKDFYSHPGFSIKAIIAAVVADIKERDLAYGGSTITQQLVKNSLLNSRKNFLRKYQEIVLAQEVERRFTKDQILEMYLNSVYFGEGAFGIEAASQSYFATSVDKLTISQASLLAGIITAPSKYSPTSGDKKTSELRQKYVLSEMVEGKYITKEQMVSAEKETLQFSTTNNGFPYKAPHFALMVKDELERKYGEEQIARSGFKIYTTLDLEWQEFAEKTVADQVKKLELSSVSNGAAVVTDVKTGEVRVAVGSRDWYNEENGKVNMVATPRQPGSSFKPVIYAQALEQKIISPATVLSDKPTTFQKNYKPENYDKKFRGNVLVRRALANSLNVPAVEVMDKVGVTEGIEFAKRQGITTLKDPANYGVSLVLGAGEVPLIELTNVYATFANKGIRNNITLITKIEDKRGELIFEYNPDAKRTLDEQVAFLISSILSDAKARREAFGNALDTERIAAVKTGTTEDYRDSLTMGYTTDIAVGVWVGNNDNKKMNKVAGSLGAAPIWKSLITKFSKGTPNKKFEAPQGVLALSICQNNGLLAKGSTSSAMTEYFIEGTQPTRPCGFNNRPVRFSRPETLNVSDQPVQPTQPQQPPQENNNNENKEKDKKNEDNQGRGGPNQSNEQQNIGNNEVPLNMLPTPPPSEQPPVPDSNQEKGKEKKESTEGDAQPVTAPI